MTNGKDMVEGNDYQESRENNLMETKGGDTGEEEDDEFPDEHGSTSGETETGIATVVTDVDGPEELGEEDSGETNGETAERRKGKILSVVHKMLKGSNYKFYTDPDRDLIRMVITGRNATYDVLFDAKEDKDQLFVYVCCSNRVPEERRLQGAEFITRANFGMAMGNFELDMNDGELRYKTSVDVEGGVLSCKMVQNMLATSIQTMERYFPGLMAVCYAGKDAAGAVADVEGNLRFICQ